IAGSLALTYTVGRNNPSIPPLPFFPMHPLDFPGNLLPSERVIFAADDEANDRLLFARLLAPPGPGNPCRFFSSGEEIMSAFLKVLRGSPAPLACFVDVKMAGVSGFDVLRWIRWQDALDSMPVIMLSSFDDPQKLNEAGGVGAQCYVKKFPSAADLHAIISAAQRYSADSATAAAFHLPCNLLLDHANAAWRAAVA
ncbi:MAG: response regulator, partial [Sulfuricaulis sp.]|nr:response regulator [Sulfuricaulis sp.]